MKLALWSVITLVAVVALFYNLTSRQNDALTVAPVLNLGVVSAGSFVSSSVEVTNPTSEPVTVLNLQTSCGCVIPNTKELTILPGKTGSIPLKINVRESSLKLAETLLFTDTLDKKNIYSVAIVATVKETLAVNPNYAGFWNTTGEKNKNDQCSLTISSSESGALSVKVVDQTAAFFAAEIVQISESTVRLFIKVDSEKVPYGEFDERLTIRCASGDDVKIREIRVCGVVKIGPFELPSYIAMPANKESAIIDLHLNRDVKLLGVDLEDGLLGKKIGCKVVDECIEVERLDKMFSGRAILKLQLKNREDLIICTQVPLYLPHAVQ